MNWLEFTRLWLWPALLALPVVWALLWALFDRTRVAARRYGAAPTDPITTPLVRSLVLTLLVGLGTLCWMDPRLGDEPVTVERRGLDLIFCLDTSRSMLARDLEPTRLQRALQDIRAVLPELQGGDRAGLVVFAGQARLGLGVLPFKWRNLLMLAGAAPIANLLVVTELALLFGRGPCMACGGGCWCLSLPPLLSPQRRSACS